MTTYAIGDVQGCYDALMRLLEHIHFDSSKDTLWFTGDLVNRGPHSLKVLRFVKQLGHRQKIVLGNHDLHLIALAFNARKSLKEDTLSAILKASDRDELIIWLRHQPLLHHEDDFLMVHAGLCNQWNLTQAKNYAKEVETLLQSDCVSEFLKNMYGDLPDQWNEKLTSWDRLRCITNYFTRARFCYPDGRLELKEKGTLDIVNQKKLIPWFQLKNSFGKNSKIIFGHWAALGGVTNTPNIYALDTGCVWGYKLTAMRLEDGERFSVSA